MITQIRPWLAAIGYSLAFGPVLGKMWRVYYIFTNPTPQKKLVCIHIDLEFMHHVQCYYWIL